MGLEAQLLARCRRGDATAWARSRELDPKLLEMWKFTHAQEYIAYLEKLLGAIKTRAR